MIKWSRSKIKAGLKQIQVFARFVFQPQKPANHQNPFNINLLPQHYPHNHLLTSFLCPYAARWRMQMENIFINGDGNPMTKATAEGRLYNHSPRLASLPGVRVRKKNLPPKSGCINHGKYFSELSQRHRNHPREVVRPQVVANLRHASVSLRVPGTEECRRSATMVVVAMVLGVSTTALRR